MGSLLRRFAVASLLAASTAAAAACGDKAFACKNDGECNDGAMMGRCESVGWCSFPDPACTSGWKFGVHAGDGLAGECVDPAADSLGDGSGDAGTSPGSPSTDGLETEGDVTGPALTTGDDATTLPPVAGCGNGIVEAEEACDGDDLAGQSCATQGFSSGTLACRGDCLGFEFDACTHCGNARLDDGELCDGAAVVANCTALGFSVDASPACDDDCELDLSPCGAPTCVGDAVDPLLPCPDACDACEDGVCVLRCEDTAECSGDRIVCPPGWPCRVECTATSACSGATIECPAFFGCDVTCEGTSACSNATVVCDPSAGSCHVLCTSDASPCANADVICGQDACTAECSGTSTPDVACGPSCDCTSCE